MGGKDTQKYSEYGHSILTIDRTNLNIALLDELSLYKNISVYFNHSLQTIDFEQKNCEVSFDGVIKKQEYDYLFGADGVFSDCRSAYEKFLNIPSQIEQIPISYKELQIPFSPLTDEWKTSKVHVWPVSPLKIMVDC
jgi:kynurenine 3-monooxygenase